MGFMLFGSEFPPALPMGNLQAGVTYKIKSLFFGPSARQERWMGRRGSLISFLFHLQRRKECEVLLSQACHSAHLGLRTSGPTQHGWPPRPCPPPAPQAVPTARQGHGGAAHAGEEGPPYPHSEDGRLPAHPLPTQSLSYIKKKIFPPLNNRRNKWLTNNNSSSSLTKARNYYNYTLLD